MKDSEMIEPTEHGIHIEKGLAWTILVAILGAGFFIGMTVAGLRGDVKLITAELARLDAVTGANAGNIDLLRRDQQAAQVIAARSDEQFKAILERIAALAEGQADISARLRAMEQQRGVVR